MTSPISAGWSEDRAAALIDACFALDGPLARALAANGRGARLEPAQLGYARMIARALARGENDPGRVTFVEGDTGIGKTLGMLIPVAAHAVLTGRQALVSTYRVHLQHQALAGDSHLAASVVEAVLGRRPIIAGRHGRRNFVSLPRLHAILAQPDLPAPCRAELQDLLRWTIAANSETPQAGCTGLIEDWRCDHGGALPGGLDADALALSSHDPADAQIAWLRHRSASEQADVLLVSHALVSIDTARWFTILGTRDGKPQRYSAVIFDEAETLPQAALAAAEESVALSSLTKLIDEALHALPAHKSGSSSSVLATIQALQDSVRDVNAALTSLRDVVAAGNSGSAPQAYRLDLTQASGGEMARTKGVLVQSLGRIADDLGQLQNHLHAVGSAETDVAAAETAARLQTINTVLREVGSNQSHWARPMVEWSPQRGHPSFRRVVQAPARMIARLWYQDLKQGVSAHADAVILTSATLGLPGVRPETRFSWLARQLGVKPETINADLSSCWAPRVYGHARFVLPHPNFPLPATEEGSSDPLWVDSTAAMIAAAAAEGGRVLVLTLSHGDTAALAANLATRGLAPDRLLPQLAGVSLRDLVQRFTAQRDAVLLTAGGWSGLDLPGLIQHLVISRLPFAPGAAVELGALPGDPHRGEQISAMMMKLRQGLGRPFRSPDDSATIWFADPRIGLPEDVADRDGLLAHPKAQPLYLSAVPQRFGAALDAARIFAPVKPGGKAPTRSRKAPAAASRRRSAP